MFCEGLQEIGAVAFSKCRALKHITLPSTAKRIGSVGFALSGLQSLNLPDSIESIGSYSFATCNSQVAESHHS